MSPPDPAKAMNGVGTGHLCDQCNKRIQHGDKAGMYVTWYDEGDGFPVGPTARTAVLRWSTPVPMARTRQSCLGCSSHTGWWR